MLKYCAKITIKTQFATIDDVTNFIKEHELEAKQIYKAAEIAVTFHETTKLRYDTTITINTQFVSIDDTMNFVKANELKAKEIWKDSVVDVDFREIAKDLQGKK